MRLESRRAPGEPSPVARPAARLATAAPSNAPDLSLPDPRRDLPAYRQQQSRRLNAFGWVDRDQGVAHVPIDRAIDIIVLQQVGAPADGRGR